MDTFEIKLEMDWRWCDYIIFEKILANVVKYTLLFIYELCKTILALYCDFFSWEFYFKFHGLCKFFLTNPLFGGTDAIIFGGHL